MGKVGWIGMGTYLLVDLEGCPAAELPALSTYVVVMAPKPCRVLVSRESAAEDRQGFCLVLTLAVSASELTSGEV